MVDHVVGLMKLKLDIVSNKGADVKRLGRVQDDH